MPGSSLSRHLESGVDPGNEVGDIITIRELKVAYYSFIRVQEV